jgi:uncharacterized protein YqeY
MRSVDPCGRTIGHTGPVGELEARLRGALRECMKARDAVATSAIRSALGAIDNAGSSGVGSPPRDPRANLIAGSAQGVGTGDVPRRELGEDQIRAIVDSEVAERRTAAEEYLRLARPQEAARVQAECDVLLGLLRQEGCPETS